MTCELISIGDELLIGQTINSNASFIARGLTAIGVEVERVTTVGDNADDLKAALALAMSRYDIVVTTGGLGPTHDDITKFVTAEYFNSGYVHHPEILDNLRGIFARRGIKMAKINEEQANIPEKATIIPNPVGSAVGLLFQDNGRRCFVLPGVPAEMKAMCEQTVFHMLQGSGQVIIQKVVRTTGVAESTLFEALGDVAEIEKLAKLAFLPKLTGVDLRLSVKSSDRVTAEEKITRAVAMLQKNIGQHIFGYDSQQLHEAVAERLLVSCKTVAVAESCTGGLLANKLTDVSGSSNYFERGIVAYSDQAKTDILGVPVEMIAHHGAVSPETALAMAEGVKQIANADYGISTTGIAGPTGGTDEKPVGLVFIAIAGPDGSYSKRFVFTRDRLFNKERTVQAVLRLLWQALK